MRVIYGFETNEVIYTSKIPSELVKSETSPPNTGIIWRLEIGQPAFKTVKGGISTIFTGKMIS